MNKKTAEEFIESGKALIALAHDRGRTTATEYHIFLGRLHVIEESTREDDNFWTPIAIHKSRGLQYHDTNHDLLLSIGGAHLINEEQGAGDAGPAFQIRQPGRTVIWVWGATK